MNSHLVKWLGIAPDLERVRDEIYERNRSWDVCPSPDDVFRSFRYFDPKDTKVIILGQDPYHSVVSNPADPDDLIRKASGLAFGYNRKWKGRIDSSLENILDEVWRTENPNNGQQPLNSERSLEHWAKQGVLLLNTRLTVEAGKPMSHAGIGWEGQIEQILLWLYHNTECIFLLWGAEARKTLHKALDSQWVSGGRVLMTSHPCKYSAHRGFIGCNHFRLANEYLKSMGKEEIKWV